MELTKLPVSPTWHHSGRDVCTPDGDFLYLGLRSITYIETIKPDTIVPIIKVFHMSQNVKGIDVDPTWSANDRRYFAVLVADNSVQIWDFDKGSVICGHQGHVNAHAANYLESRQRGGQTQDVLLSYMPNKNVLSIDPNFLVVYCVLSNTYYRRDMFATIRNQQFSVLKCCPYRDYIFALGTTRGMVLICDLQKMTCIYTLSGHENCISALSWTFRHDTRPPRKPVAAIVTKQDTTTETKPASKAAQPKNDVKKLDFSKAADFSDDDTFNIYDYDYLENEYGAPVSDRAKKPAEVDTFVGLEKPKDMKAIAEFNFAEACESLKGEIDALNTEEKKELLVSSEESLEILPPPTDDSDSDELYVDGSERKPNMKILHQAEVHATQTLERENDKTNDKTAKGTAESVEIKENTSINVTDKKAKYIEQKQKKVEVSDSEIQQENNIKTTEEAKTCTDGHTTPAHEPPKTEQMRGDLLLASASVDARFWVWNVDTGSSCDDFKARTFSQPAKNIHIQVGWASNGDLIITNKHGTCVYWALLPHDDKQQTDDDPRSYKFKEQECKFGQPRVVSFSVAQTQNLFWSITHSREVYCEDLKSGEVLCQHSCAPTNITAMKQCPISPKIVVFADPDGSICKVNMGAATPKKLVMQRFNTHLDTQILCFAFNTECTKLAYGTFEGRVGILVLESSKAPPLKLNSISGKPVYSLAFPKYGVFAVCNKKVGAYLEQMHNKDPYIIRDINVPASNIAATDDVLLVGDDRGMLNIYSKIPTAKLAYQLMQTVPIAPHYISEIVWSPLEQDKFAVISNSNVMQVLRFDSMTKTASILEELEISTGKVSTTCVCWSHHNKNELLTCSANGSVRIWDLNSPKKPKFHKQFKSPVNAGLFLTETLVMCCGKYMSIELFDLNAPETNKTVEDSSPPKLNWACKIDGLQDSKSMSNTKKRRLRRQQKEKLTQLDASRVDALESQLEGLDIGAGDADTKPATSTLVSNEEEKVFAANLTKQSSSTKLIEKIAKEVNSPDTAASILKTLFVKGSKELSKESLNCAKLFAGPSEAMNLLNDEMKNLTAPVNHVSQVFLPLAGNQLKEQILSCIQSKKLTELHVSLAPTISYSFWSKCCQAYAEQLVENDSALHAATYLMAAHNKTAAIELLVESKYFKEALLVARAYLQPKDPLIVSIIEKWIAYVNFTGNFFGAALLCTLAGKIGQAIEIISKVRREKEDADIILELMKDFKKNASSEL